MNWMNWPGSDSLGTISEPTDSNNSNWSFVDAMTSGCKPMTGWRWLDLLLKKRNNTWFSFHFYYITELNLQSFKDECQLKDDVFSGDVGAFVFRAGDLTTNEVSASVNKNRYINCVNKHIFEVMKFTAFVEMQQSSLFGRSLNWLKCEPDIEILCEVIEDAEAETSSGRIFHIIPFRKCIWALVGQVEQEYRQQQHVDCAPFQVVSTVFRFQIDVKTSVHD